MFDSLKSKASAKAYDSFVNAITPKIAPILERARAMAPELVIDDSSYRSHVVEPAWLAVGGITSGVTSLIPNLHSRFVSALLHARSELVVIDTTAKTVALVENATERLPHVLLDGLKKPVVDSDK